MVALFSLLTIIVLSIIVVRVGTVALELTGLSQDVAGFQAQSAFSGAGFTTSESESIVSHPVRRRIARILILLGSAGFSSAIATLILTFIGPSSTTAALRMCILGAGVLCIYLLARSRFIYLAMKRTIMKVLKRYSTLYIYDYYEILGLQKGYMISRFKVKRNSWMSGCSLKDLNLHLEGLIILSITRAVEGDEKFIGVPKGDTVVQEGDVLICYGREDAIESLSNRVKGREGDDEHEREKVKERQESAKRDRKGGYS